MKIFKIIPLTVLMSAVAFGQTSNVEITGALEPKFSVDINESELNDLANSLINLENGPDLTVDINTLYSKNDVPAFTAVREEIARIFIEAAKTLVDMKAIAYKTSIANKTTPDQKVLEIKYQNYQKLFQLQFGNLLSLYLGDSSGYNAKITNAIERCFTDKCVSDIASIQFDLVNYGKSINEKITLDRLSKWDVRANNFRNKTIKDVLAQTLESLNPPNENESAYYKLVKGALSPLIILFVGGKEVGASLAHFIAARSATHFKISADPVTRSAKGWRNLENSFLGVVNINIETITLNRTGGKKYTKPKTPETNPPQLNELETKIQTLFNEKLVVGLNKIKNSIIEPILKKQESGLYSSDAIRGEILDKVNTDLRSTLPSALLGATDILSAQGMIRFVDGRDFYDMDGTTLKMTTHSDHYWATVTIKETAEVFDVSDGLLSRSGSGSMISILCSDDAVSNYGKSCYSTRLDYSLYSVVKETEDGKLVEDLRVTTNPLTFERLIQK